MKEHISVDIKNIHVSKSAMCERTVLNLAITSVLIDPTSSLRKTDIFLECFARLLKYKNILISIEMTVENFLPPGTLTKNFCEIMKSSER